MDVTNKQGSLSELLAKMGDFRYDSAALQQIALDYRFDLTQGEIDVLDATNPGVYLMEISTVGAALANNEMNSIYRRVYATLAQSEEDINRHLSDKEDLGRFATPSLTQINLALDLPSILQYAVTDPETGRRRLLIPEDAVFSVGGVDFGIYYPIYINLLHDDAINVLWDTNTENPMYTLTTNELEHVYRTSTESLDDNQGNTYRPDLLDITIPVAQFNRARSYYPLNRGTGFVVEIPFNNRYYFARIFTGNKQTGWSYLHTTHSNQVYNNDSKRATALLSVFDGKLRVEIPQIFFTQGVLGTDLRIDIYTTRGELSMNLGEFSPVNFKATFENANPFTSKFSAPLDNMRSQMVYSRSRVVGGSNGKSYEEMREMAINNSIINNIAITPDQLDIDLKTRGYELVNYRDYITENVYLAARHLPDLILDGNALTVSGGIMLLAASARELTALETVRDNTFRLTIMPSTLYKMTNGVVKLLTDTERKALEGASNTTKIVALNGEVYLYSPFHYLYDMSLDYFGYHGYYLTEPYLKGKFFKDANETTEINAVTTNVELLYTENGYVFNVEVAGNEQIRPLLDSQLLAQLSFVGRHETASAFLNGTFKGRTESGGFVFSFTLESNFDLTQEMKEHFLYFTNFKVNPADSVGKWAKLTQLFTLTYSLTNYAGALAPSNLDAFLGKAFLPADAICITHEELNVRLGVDLTGLFENSRPVSSSVQYELYTQDIPAVWPNDVIKTGPNGETLFTPNPAYPSNPKAPPLLYEYEHRQGDPILEEDGTPRYAHRKGTVKTDGNDKPIISRERTTLFETYLMFFDAKFRFVTEENGKRYGKELPGWIISYIENDILPYRQGMLNLTTVEFYPKKTAGKVTVNVSDNNNVYIDSIQRPVYNIYVEKNVFEDAKLRSSIVRTVKRIATNRIRQTVVSTEDILTEIKSALSDTVITVSGGLLGDDRNLARYTVLNGNDATTIGCELVAQSDGTLRLDDTITVNFFKADKRAGITR